MTDPGPTVYNLEETPDVPQPTLIPAEWDEIPDGAQYLGLDPDGVSFFARRKETSRDARLDGVRRWLIRDDRPRRYRFKVAPEMTPRLWDILTAAGKQRLVSPDHPLIQAARAVGTSFGD